MTKLFSKRKSQYSEGPATQRKCNLWYFDSSFPTSFHSADSVLSISHTKCTWSLHAPYATATALRKPMNLHYDVPRTSLLFGARQILLTVRSGEPPPKGVEGLQSDLLNRASAIVRDALTCEQAVATDLATLGNQTTHAATICYKGVIQTAGAFSF